MPTLRCPPPANAGQQQADAGPTAAGGQPGYVDQMRDSYNRPQTQSGYGGQSGNQSGAPGFGGSGGSGNYESSVPGELVP